MTKEESVSPENVREFLDYDPKTGLFIWKPRDLKWYKDQGGRYTAQWCQSVFNSKCAGKPAFNTPNGRGYLIGRIWNRNYFAHRIAWAHYHGSWPSGSIDHINRVRTDNRVENLRVVSTGLNNHNRRSPDGRFLGVTWWDRSQKWLARIAKDGEKYYLGYFDDPVEAAKIRDAKAVELYGVDARLNFPRVSE